MIAEIDTQTPLILMAFFLGAGIGVLASILVTLQVLSNRK